MDAHTMPTRRGLLARLAALTTIPAAFYLLGWESAAHAAVAPAAIAPEGVKQYASIEEEFEGTMLRLFGDKTVDYNGSVVLTAPQMAENGRVVPVEVKFEYPADLAAPSYPQRLYLIVDKNRRPLSVVFAFAPTAGSGYAACNLRMGASSPIRAIIEMSDGKLVGAVKNVNVVVGGCGG
jgi:sulfur-oxidizing protein SoxY